MCGILKKHFGSWFVSPAHRGKILQLFRDCSHTINTELVFSLLFHEYTKNHTRVQTTQQPTTLSARIGFSLQRLHGGDSTQHEQNVVNCLLFFFSFFAAQKFMEFIASVPLSFQRPTHALTSQAFTGVSVSVIAEITNGRG